MSAKWGAELVIFTYVDEELVSDVVARNWSGSLRDRKVRCTWKGKWSSITLLLVKSGCKLLFTANTNT